MNPPSKAIHRPKFAVSEESLTALLKVCDKTLRATPMLSEWVCNVRVAPDTTLPFLPIRCFRHFNVSHINPEQNPEQAIRSFRSSGSTNSNRARHTLGATGWASYQRAALQGFRHAAQRLRIPENSTILSLVPPPEQWPDSSLAAMIGLWKEGGLDVQYADVEKNPSAVQDFFTSGSLASGARDCVVFGTSLHLLILEQWRRTAGRDRPFINAGKTWIFDTGGTKGRTLHTSSLALQDSVRNWFHTGCVNFFLSEYGMCELLSQAYSAASPHDGLFECSPTLHALVLDSSFAPVKSFLEQGFLAFIDEANQDSWPFIITEDLGQIPEQDGRQFRLLGRAPDAAVKGCSLNVRTGFRFDLIPAQPTSPRHPSALKSNDGGIKNGSERQLFDAHRLLGLLRDPCWNQPALKDLAACLRGCEKIVTDDYSKRSDGLNGERLAITASANIPVTWLFPAVHAWLMNAAGVEIYLPSVRDQDPLSGLIRRQIETLADAFNHCTRKGFVETFNERLPLDTAARKVLLFGHDETIRSIRSEFVKNNHPAQLIGLGHFRNSIRINPHDTAASLADKTGLWLGRGCLTPLLAIFPCDWNAEKRQSFIETWKSCMVETFRERLAGHGKNAVLDRIQFAHRHNLAELRATISAFRLDCFMAEVPEFAIVAIDFSACDTSRLSESGITASTLDWAGAGWLNFVSANQLPDEWLSIPEHDCSPSLWDHHQGRTWAEWLNQTHDPAHQI